MRIYVHTEGKIDPDVLDVEPESSVAAAFGLSEAEHVLPEDGEHPLDREGGLVAAGVQDRAHVFRGKRHKILVTVEFNNERHSDEFTAATRVERVFRWAVGSQAFDLDPQDAAEHTLALPDGSIPPEDAHIGSLPEEQEGDLRFLLIAKHRYQG